MFFEGPIFDYKNIIENLTLKNKIQLTPVLLKSDNDLRLILSFLQVLPDQVNFPVLNFLKFLTVNLDKQALIGLVMHTHATVSWDPKSFWKIEARLVVLKLVSNQEKRFGESFNFMSF